MVTYKIEQDDCGQESPRDWDNLGTMVSYRQGYGDAYYKDVGDISENVILLNIRAYEHGMLSITASNYGWLSSSLAESSRLRAISFENHFRYPFNCQWDSYWFGYIYVTYEDALAEFGRKRMSHKLAKKIESILRSEVEEYNQYLTGDVWGYIVEDRHGEVLDSCWGFYGYDYCEEEAKRVAKYYQEQEDQELIELQSISREVA